MLYLPQDTVLTARVTRVNPLFGDEGDENNYRIDNAQVTITDGNTTVTLLYDEIYDYYTCPATNLPIQAGQSYALKIVVPGYPTLTATTEVPQEQPSGLTAVVDQFDLIENTFEGNFVLVADLAWNDVAAADSYYRGVITYNDTLEFDGGMQINNLEIVNFYEEDEVTNQGRIEQKHSGSIYAYGLEAPERFRFYLLNCNKDYYEFHKSVANINYGSPFSEPSLIYSNTQGGLGVFAAFQQAAIWFEP